MGSAIAIVLLPFVIVIAAISALIYHFVRKRQLTRLHELAPDDFVFTFTSTGWYQAAIVELRQRGVISSDTRTDSEDPFRRGPRWVAASSSGIRIMRGFGTEPTLTLPWTGIDSIKRETRVRRGYNNGTYVAVTINVRAAGHDIALVLSNPDSRFRVWSTKATADEVFDELERLRGGNPGSVPDKPVVL